MHALRTVGVMSTAVAVLLSASVAFAQGRPTPPTGGPPGGNKGSDYRAALASSTATTTRGTSREEAKARVEAQREKVAQRLLDIQDKKKQEMAARIANQFDSLNKKWTDHFMNLLNRYEALLGKVEAKVGSSGGTASTTAAIQSAKTAIETARLAVTAQAAKTYVIATSTLPTTATSTPTGQQKLMQGLRKSFQDMHSTLFKDLFALRDGVMKDARKAVQDAIKTLGKNRGDSDTNATSTEESDD